MFEKIRALFRKKNKRPKKYTQTNMRFGFLKEEKTSSFKKRRKNIFSKNIFNNLSWQSKKNSPLLIGFILICFIVGISFLVTSLKVTDIYIYRQDSIINIDQAYGNVEYIRGKNILLLDTSEIAERLQKAQKSISNIKFDTQFPNRLNINIGSYAPIFQTPQYLILSNGVVIPKESKKYSDIPFIQVSKDIEEYALFGNTLNIENLKNINTLTEEARKNILGFDFQKIRYYIAEKELLLLHNSGTIFIFDLTLDIPSQIKKLAVYASEKGDIYGGNYIYVDVRIPGKLFLCSTDSEYNCRNNMEYIYGKTIFEQLKLESSEPQQ